MDESVASMRIISYLSPLLLPKLADAIHDLSASHVQATSWAEVEAAFYQYPRSVGVLDPQADRTNRAADIAMLIERFPSSPIIVYTEFSPVALQALTFLAPHGLYETLLFQIDDSRARFSRLLLRAATHSLVVRLLNELRPRSRHLPTQLADAIEDLFRRPQAYASGQDLILASRVPSTSLQRALAEAGIAPPKRLFIAARVLHAISYLRDPLRTVEQVAEQTGYQQPRIMTQHTLAVFGARPSQLRTISDDEALAALSVWTRIDPLAKKSPSVAPERREDSSPSIDGELSSDQQ